MNEFDKYIVLDNPEQKEKPKAWQTQTMSSLRNLDALKGSAYLFDTAHQHIKGNIFIDKPE